MRRKKRKKKGRREGRTKGKKDTEERTEGRHKVDSKKKKKIGTVWYRNLSVSTSFVLNNFD